MAHSVREYVLSAHCGTPLPCFLIPGETIVKDESWDTQRGQILGNDT